MRVIVPEPNHRYDFKKAAVYGEVVFLYEEAQNPFRDDLLAEFVTRLEELGFDPEEDSLCMTGQNLILAQLLAAVLAKFGKVRTLMFDARVGDYRLKMLEAA